MHAIGLLLSSCRRRAPSGGDRLRGGAIPPLVFLLATGVEALADADFGSVATQRFVPVEADGLERPELADLYRTAVALLPDAPQASSGRLLYLLTPDRRPFAAVPCESPGIAAVLEGRAAEFRDRRVEMERRAGAVVAALRDSQSGEPAQRPLGEDVPARALAGLVEAMDPVRGGYRKIPKTPPHGALLLLLEEQRRLGGPDGLRLLKATLDGMARGGIRDPGAGFFLGAETESWGRPRLSKRLVDNALLLRAYAQAHELLGDDRYRVIADEIANFCIREGREGDGSFGAELPIPGIVGSSRDTRVFASFNGLMISGLAASGRRGDLEAAERPHSAVLASGPRAAGRCPWRRAQLPALLEDRAVPDRRRARPRRGRLATGAGSRRPRAWRRWPSRASSTPNRAASSIPTLATGRCRSGSAAARQRCLRRRHGLGSPEARPRHRRERATPPWPEDR
jgi:uncharacterized protein YyaL (SSP411 family)